MTNRFGQIVAVAGLVAVAGCGGDSFAGLDPASAPPSVAFGAWRPGPTDTCPVSVHQQYSTVGPDGKSYPTWHPPVDPATGCSFGHEHGRDPAGSRLAQANGPLAFGYANEQLDIWDPSGKRHEDHVGHKVEWENDVQMRVANASGSVISVRCDILYKLHQGTHSRDAFTNNLHEVIYYAKCNDGTELRVTMMAAIGRPGEFIRNCDRARIQVGTATPANSPSGGGQRILPDRTCAERHLLVGDGAQSRLKDAMHESWEQSLTIKTPEGKTLAHMDPYFQVTSPSRFYDPDAPNFTGRPIDLCYLTLSDGRRARGAPCASATQNGAVTGITYDDPRSPFNGVRRFVDLNSLDINNADGPTSWYTDPFGRGAKTEPFPGAIRQYIARINNTGLDLSGPSIGSSRDYGVGHAHSPN